MKEERPAEGQAVKKRGQPEKYPAPLYHGRHRKHKSHRRSMQAADDAREIRASVYGGRDCGQGAA